MRSPTRSPAPLLSDVAVHFTVGRQDADQHRYRSRGGPVTVYAQALHAQLYGLPTGDEPVPAALDALLQAAHITDDPEQQSAILRQLAEQLRNAAEILQWARNHAQWRQLPNSAGEWPRDVTAQVRVLADGLDTVRTAFTAGALGTAPAGPAGQKAVAAIRPYAVPLTTARGPRR